MHAVTELIPHRPPFLFVDEIVSQSPDGLIAKRTWRADEDFYKGHYPGAPITPGVLLCEAVFQTAACYMALKARAAGAKPGEGVPLIAKISAITQSMGGALQYAHRDLSGLSDDDLRRLLDLIESSLHTDTAV